MDTLLNSQRNKAPNSQHASQGLTPINTQALFPNGSKEITIVHDNTEYRLRITSQGKLILTK